MSAVKPKKKPNDKAQSKRFIDKARELDADESETVFERAFKRAVPEKRASQTPDETH